MISEPITLSTLRTRALDYFDDDTPNFAVAARVDEYINRGLAHVYNLLVNARGDYFRSLESISMVAETEEYDLPSNFYKALGVYYLSGDRWYPLEVYERAEAVGYQRGPLRSGTVNLEYVPRPPVLTRDDDKVEWEIPCAWEDYAALFAAKRLKIREESDPGALNTELAMIEAEIQNMAEPRDMQQGRVIDRAFRWNRLAPVLSERRHLRYRIQGRKLHLIEFEHLGA